MPLGKLAYCGQPQETVLRIHNNMKRDETRKESFNCWLSHSPLPLGLNDAIQDF